MEKSHSSQLQNTDGPHDLESPTENFQYRLQRPKALEKTTTGAPDLMFAQEPAKKKVTIKFCVFVTCLTFLFIGRYSVPSNDPPCIVDKVQLWFEDLNVFLMTKGNEAWRDSLQIICSLFMDLMFFITGAYWILRGSSSRLVVATLSFYIVRAIVQALWFSPFPAEGYWWYDPGFPSFVVPYGKGSDFFFSGHIGFIVICASEWKKYGEKVAVWILSIGGVYTAFILIAYKVHYSIDIFTGVFFAHWTYHMVDYYKDPIDSFFIRVFYRGKEMLQKGAVVMNLKKDPEKELLY